MTKIYTFSILGLIGFLLGACDPTIEDPNVHVTLSNELEYSFLVCGHTYGDPDNWVEGLYPEFVSFFPFINSYPGMSLGMFTGDVIPKDDDYRWDFALRDMAKLNFPTFIAPGNHDLGFNIFYDRFGYFYKSFFWHDDLFILLTPNLDKWNISGQQLDFLKNTLKYDGAKARNIYVFHHELLWYDTENKFSVIAINWDKHYPGSTNYFDEVIPLFIELGKPSYFFAGDLGARDYATPFMYYEEDNIHFIASGMGAGIDDNFIIAEVKENGEIDFKLCAMQGAMNRLGDLEDYKLPDK